MADMMTRMRRALFRSVDASRWFDVALSKSKLRASTQLRGADSHTDSVVP